MHGGVRSFVSRIAADLPSCRTLEIGSRNINGSVRDLFSGEYVGIDLIPGNGVDVVVDVRTYQPEKQFNVIVCCEVLEHAEDAVGIISAAYRLLAPGGMFILTCATDPRAPHSALDGGPLRPSEFYRNVPISELRTWLSDFERIEIDDRTPGDIYVVAWKANNDLASNRAKRVRKVHRKTTE